MKKFFIAILMVLILAGSSLAFDMPWDLGTRYCKLIQKTTAPTTSDYTYQLGTVWLDTTNDKSYTLLDNTASAAVWSEVTTPTPTYGAEKATDGDFAVGTCASWTFNTTDWTCGAANIAKDANGTNTLSQNMTEAAGQYVRITMDVSGFSAGTFTVAYGASYTQTCDSANGATQSITQYHTAQGTTNFTITPSNDARFVLDNISVKIMTNGGLTLYNPFIIPLGSVGYPAICLLGDENSGLFWDVNRAFHWVIDGASVANISSTGIATIAGANETYASGWNADTGVPEKDDIYDYLHLIDTNDDGTVENLGYRTIYIPAASMTSTATNGATFGTYEYATNDINADFYAFDGATEQFVECEFPMPEDWNLGTVKAKAFWSSATASTAGDTCEWEIQGGAQSNDDAIDAALGTAQVISDVLLADNGADRQLSNATPAITIGGTPALGDMTHWKISRNVGGTDDMTEKGWLFGFWIQYLANTSVATW